MTTGDVTNANVLHELSKVVGALLGTRATIREAAVPAEPGFVASVSGGGDRLQVFFARSGATAFVAALDGPGIERSDAAIADRLEDLCAQAAVALAAGHHTGLRVESVRIAAEPPDPAAQAATIVIDGHECVLDVAVSSQLGAVAASAAPPQRARTLDAILDIDLPLVVRFGRTELPLNALTALGPGSVIDLGRTPDELVDVLISNRVVARGEVVIVSGNYGVRIREVVSPAERARSLEGDLT